MLETLSEHPDTYESVDGTVHDLTGLDAEARDALARLIEFFNWHPPYPQFRTYWRDKNSPIRTFLEHGNPHRELFRTIAKDLEHRLGVAQGRIEEQIRATRGFYLYLSSDEEGIDFEVVANYLPYDPNEPGYIEVLTEGEMTMYYGPFQETYPVGPEDAVWQAFLLY